MSYKIEDFKLDLRKCVSPPNYIWVNSGFSTCAPIADTVMGVQGCFSPPLAAKDTALTFKITANDHLIADTGDRGKDDCGLLFSGAEWRPDKLVRKGTYHYITAGELLSFSVISELVPLSGRSGFLVKISIHNRGDNRAELYIHAALQAGSPSYVTFDKWGFMPPEPSSDRALEIAKNMWENKEVRVTLLTDSPSAASVEKGDSAVFRFAVIFTQPGVSAGIDANLREWKEATRKVWEDRIEAANRAIPELRSNIPGLEEYYLRSLISGLVCFWDNDDYIVKPFPATSGMDGGSICCYPWDVAGYSAQTLIMLLGGKTKDFLKRMLASGIDSHNSMSLDGGGLGGCSYSYSMWSIINLFWNIITMNGEGRELFDDVVRLFLTEEARLKEKDNLKDYGRQHNLLEMRSCGYEYYVPSPNAERAWCYERLADAAKYLGRDNYHAWYEKADKIKKSIANRLWDEESEWFRCIHPDGHVEIVYTIQAFDVLRMGACTEQMEIGLLKHLREGAFLGKYGVSSISAEDDLHYELNDPDWSGGGCYSGDGPVLAEILWESGHPHLAWDVLKRHFWMGEMLPYFPQEHNCDKPSMPVNKRANIIAGVAGLQAILFGMAGLKYEIDGSLVIKPQPPEEGFVEIKGIRHKGALIDLSLSPGLVKINKNNSVFYEGMPTEIHI